MTDKVTMADATNDERLVEYLQERGCSFADVPPYMHGGAARYILWGIAPGGFLTAVFSNDLKGAFGKADAANTRTMRDWVMFAYNEMPHASQGSPEAVSAWIKQGGMLGRESDVA